MRTFIAVVILLLPSLARSRPIPEPQVRTAWLEYKNQFKRQYPDEETERRHYAIFKANIEHVEDLNDANASSNGNRPFGVNAFSDIDPAEFKAKRMGFNPSAGRPYGAPPLPVPAPQPTDPNDTSEPNSIRNPRYTAAPPASVDYRTRGVLSPIKDQGGCGSCWAFATVEQVETEYAIKHKTTPPLLSVQQVVACDAGDNGCGGGDAINSYQYIQNYGLMSAEAYPYTSGDNGTEGNCYYNPAFVSTRTANAVQAIPLCADDDIYCTAQSALEPQLMQNIATYGPASVCVNATGWQFYKGGIVSGNCDGAWAAMNHCVQLVGYSTDPNNGAPFWLIRNQWGTGWGEDGYMRIAMGHNDCGLLNECLMVTVN